MIRAYDKIYLDYAQTNLARMLDFAVYDLKYDAEVFFKLFISSGVASRFQRGDYSVIAGMSGVELAYKVLECSGINADRIKPNYPAERSREYWAGWALAYYQWYVSISFSEIMMNIPLNRIILMYSPYHEMDIRRFCDDMNMMIAEAKPVTNLKIRRKNAGLSQKELAEQSDIPLRTIQQYEQRQKNINKARAEYLVMLSRTLCCRVDDLLEPIEIKS